MALRNLKYFVPAIKGNRNAAVLTQIQFEANASDPTDGDLAAGRLHYKTGTGLRWYDGSTWYTIPTSTSGGGLSAWDELYALDKTLTINSTTLTYALTHATNNGLTITGSAGSAGHCLQITNSGSGNDINGTSNLWSVSAAGLATFATNSVIGGILKVGSGSADGEVTSNGAYNLVISTNSGTNSSEIEIVDAANGDVDITLNGTGAVNINGTTTHNDALVVAAGDVQVTTGHLALTDDQNAESVTVINNTATTIGNASSTSVFQIESTSLTTGCLLNLQLTEGTLAGGSYLRAWDATGGSAVFTVAENGLTTIAGSASGTDALVLTNGDILVTAGHVDMTVGDLTLADGSVTVTDADNAASLSVTNNTATTASVVALAGSGVFTGSTTTSWMTITPSGMTSGTGVYAVFGGMTTGKGVHIATDATQTTGNALYVQCTGADSAITSGTLASFDLTSTAITSAVNKTGSGVAVTSSRTTTTGTVSDNFDLVSIVRTDIINGAGSMTATGSVLYVENAVTNTSGTVTDTTKGIELVMDSLGTGAGLNVTHAATGGVAVNVVGAATSVDDVLITGSGVKASDKASLQVVNSGNTAAGGSILRVASGASTPAAATSYLAEFTYAASTMTNNPITIQIDGGASTGAVINVTGSGAGNSLSTYNTNTGATGVQWFTEHTSTGSAADNDVVFQLTMAGLDDANATNNYGRIICQANDVSAGSEDGRLEMWVSVGGTLTEVLSVESTTGGALDTEIASATMSLAGSAAGTTAFTMTAGDLSLSAGGIDTTTTADQYGLSVTVNKTAATQAVAQIVNAHTTSAKPVLQLSQADLDQPYIDFTGATQITSASAGANGDVPAQVREYILVETDAGNGKIPVYAV